MFNGLNFHVQRIEHFDTLVVMDIERARMKLNQDLELVRHRRDRLHQEVDELGVEIGALSETLSDLGQSKNESAQIAGVSASRLSDFAARAREAGLVVPDPRGQLDSLRGTALREFVHSHGGPARIVASFDDWDAMHMAKLDPELFYRRGDGLVRENMLVSCADGAWVAVDNVNVGYGGTGPTNAIRELETIGLDGELARDIAYSRVSDVFLNDTLAALSTSEFTREWPHTDLGPMERLDAGRFVVRINADGFGQDDDTDGAFARRRAEKDTLNGMLASEPRRSRLRAWMARFDDPDIDWLYDRPRRGRVYLDWRPASAAGYTSRRMYPFELPAVYTVIIEQGPIQLWLKVPSSNDEAQLFSPEVYATLAVAGFYTDDLDPTAGRGAFTRWLASLGRTLPDYVDLDGLPLIHPDPANQ